MNLVSNHGVPYAFYKFKKRLTVLMWNGYQESLKNIKDLSIERFMKMETPSEDIIEAAPAKKSKRINEDEEGEIKEEEEEDEGSFIRDPSLPDIILNSSEEEEIGQNYDMKAIELKKGLARAATILQKM